MSQPIKPTAAALLFAVILVVVSVILVVSGAIPPNWRKGLDISDYDISGPLFRIVSYDALEGWRQDSLGDALPAFLLSCEKLKARDKEEPFNPAEAMSDVVIGEAPVAGTVADWLPICAGVVALDSGDYTNKSAYAAAVRDFFETNLTPVRVLSELTKKDQPQTRPVAWPTGRFTGYFEPVYPASLSPSSLFSAPVYERPDDLIMVDLGRFRERLAGDRVAGRVLNGRLLPYDDHAAINSGALRGKTRTIAYMDPNDLFFLQIQGSGRLLIGDGNEMLVGYDGQNGHPYYAIGRSLIERNILTRENVSLQSIRDWLTNATPDEARALREENASYVFFKTYESRPDPELGPYGSQGIQLTASRSIAVDTRYHGLGAPIWVHLEEGQLPNYNAGALMIAQDTGGAIKGPVRGDVYIGSGPAAGQIAGRMNEEGELFIFLPNAVADRLEGRLSP